MMPFVSIGMVTGMCVCVSLSLSLSLSLTMFLSSLLDVIIKESFTHGGSYYVTVSGCSRFSGCTIAHSDGIIIDVTPSHYVIITSWINWIHPISSFKVSKRVSK